MDHLNGAERHARHRRSGLRGAMLPPNCCCQRSAACCRLPTAKSIASSSGGISHLQFYQRSCANALLPSALAAASVSAASFSRLVPAAPARADRTRGPTSSASAASTPCGTTSVGRRRAPRGAPRSTTEHHGAPPALLHHQPPGTGRLLRARRPQSLAVRERLSLDTQSRFQRSPAPRAAQRRTGDHRHLRRWALSLMRQVTSQKTGLKGRRLIAGWDPDYLLPLLRVAVPTTDANS